MPDLQPSARLYTRFHLSYYDHFVLGFVSTWLWRASSSIQLLFFKKYIGENAHMDVGVGTGYYTAASAPQLAKTKNVTLLDVNPNTLELAEARLLAAGYRGTTETVRQSVFDPLPVTLRGRFDSISLLYTLHVLPGTFPIKASHVFANLSAGLASAGVLYGTTVLGKDAGHSWLGRLFLRRLNQTGIFGNATDTLENLEKALRGSFEEVEIWQTGVVAFFVARKPFRKYSISNRIVVYV
ncbi:hypothetical protein IEO21_06793 [Rhodonia placenta]|uniref:Methyltransferase type 12 domain-containing protein n=1 Tax=Rhodonia placenta TaxID=104341 RepID=A0A8H7U0T3_9APHY|nr:hypothetical protein IEO21_06793 [Postia placenta]